MGNLIGLVDVIVIVTVMLNPIDFNMIGMPVIVNKASDLKARRCKTKTMAKDITTKAKAQFFGLKAKAKD